MRICLPTNQDLLAVPLASDDWPCEPRPVYSAAQWHVECLKYPTSVDQVIRCIRQGFDLFFNLCDGAADQNSPGIEVVRWTSQPIVGAGLCDKRSVRARPNTVIRRRDEATSYRHAGTAQVVTSRALMRY